MSTATTALGGIFNARSVAPQAALDPIPGGDYKCAITAGSVETSPGKRRVSFEWTVLEGPHQGRKIFDGLNIENPSAENQRISQAQFSGICHAVGVYDVSDISALFNIPHTIKVDVEPEKYVNAENQPVASDYPGAKKYDARNRFKGAKFALPGQTVPGAGAQTPPPFAPAGGAAGGPTPPWGAPGGAVTPPAAPPAAPAKPGKPKAPGKPAVAAKPREFYVNVDGQDGIILENVLADWLAKGLPATTLCALNDGKGEWQEASKFNIQAPGVATPPPPAPPATQATPPPAPATGGNPVPPWGRPA